MRYLPAILLIGASLIPVGCNSDLRCRRETALLRAEYLDLEDKYYALLAEGSESDVVITDDSTDESFYASSTLAQSGATSEFVTGSPIIAESEIVYYDQSPTYESQTSTPVIYSDATIIGSGVVLDAATPTPQETGRVSSTPTRVDVETENDRPLENKTPAPAKSSGELPAPSSKEEIDGEVSILDMDNQQPRLDFASQSNRVSSQPAEVASIRINTSVSHGEAVDQIPGDDKLKILLQPLDTAGNVIEQAGNLSLSVIDEAAPQGEQQIGYWEFLRSEAELFFARDEFGNRGMLLELPWEDRVPVHPNLTVYIRFENRNGTVLETTQRLTIDPPPAAKPSSEPTLLSDAQTGDWYKSQSRSRNTSDQGNANGRSSVGPHEDSQIQTHPIDRSSGRGSNTAGQSYYQRPSWKPVR